ncbi:MAG: 2-aminoethylphosphonate--pyruvate transaminase [Candidatus Aegiribacteria sp.]|nr:2-aminoethylphosphonate--pyruvate transaminase [Candidatus Aegiribacteria sp.]
MKKIKRNILLNPGPATTTDTVKYAQVVPDICPREKEFGDIVRELTRDLVKIVHGEDNYDCILFGGSGTSGVEAVISSVVPADKKILVVSNGAYGTRMAAIAASYGIGTINYRIPYGDYPDIAAVEELISQNRNSISHMGIVHHETTTGMLNPVEDFLALARRYGIELIVDTISSYAGIPIDLRINDYDYIVSTANKNIQGMAGVSFVICKNSLLNGRAPAGRSYYLNLYQQYAFLKNSGQMQFTPPVQVIYALYQAVKEYFLEGAENRFKRYRENWQILINGLLEMGFKLLLPLEHQSGLLTAILDPQDKNYHFNEMHDYLYHRGYTIYPGKGAKESTFRIANIGEIYSTDIKDFLNNLKSYLNQYDIRYF